MSVNVAACINVGQVVARGMEKANIAGSIVNISSIVRIGFLYFISFTFLSRKN